MCVDRLALLSVLVVGIVNDHEAPHVLPEHAAEGSAPLDGQVQVIGVFNPPAIMRARL
jgi:hypothetical protein